MSQSDEQKTTLIPDCVFVSTWRVCSLISSFKDITVSSSAAQLAEKRGSEDQDSHDLPITRDRNDRDRECHLTYKH